MMADKQIFVRLKNVQKQYGEGNSAVTALDNISVEFPASSFTAIMGPSGSGKSTLLHCAAGLDEATSGEVFLVGNSVTGLSETQLTLLRRNRVAFIFQSYNLMPALNVWDNVTLPATLGGHRIDRQWVKQVIERVGLSERIKHRPGELSGGQKQRVAIARALATQPDITFADEPTGALDTQSAKEVLTLLRDLAELGQTVIMVTHDPVAASYAQNVIFLVDGRIVSRLAKPTAQQISEQLTRLDSKTSYLQSTNVKDKHA